MKAKNYIGKIASIAAALLIWQAAAAIVSNFFLPTPLEVFGRLIKILSEGDSYSRMGFTFLSLGGGFLLGLLCGAALAVLAARWRFIEQALWPFMLTFRSVPVVSFIILAYLYLSSRSIPVLIAFMIVLPVVYGGLLTGIKAEDKKMREMADVFSLSGGKRFLYITLPQIKPHLLSASQNGIGLAFKSGAAAEVITLAAGSIGEQLFMGKLNLEIDLLFAWTLILVALCYGFEWLFGALLRLIFRRLERL